MPNKHAERGGQARAEDNQQPARAVLAFGTNGWRTVAPLGAAYGSDSAVRWDVREHRAELEAAGAVLMIRGRLFFFEPAFSQTLIRIAQRRASDLSAAQLTRAQAEADALARHFQAPGSGPEDPDRESPHHAGQPQFPA